MDMREDPKSGRPNAASRVAHGYRAAVVALLLLLLAAGLYGAGGPFVWGHYGYHAGEYSTRARHTLRHHTLLPSNAPGYSKPEPETYYLHHPILTHQIVTLTLLIFGESPVAVRAAALISTVAAFLLLITLVRRYWGQWQSLLAGALFVLVPIHVWFAPHIDPGLPGIACVLGAFLCYLPWLNSGKWTMGAGTLLLLMLAALFEWSPYLAAVPLGAHALYCAVRQRGRYLRFVGLLVLSLLLPLLFHAGLIIATGHGREMRESFLVRSGGPGFIETMSGIGSGAYEMFGVPLLVAMALWLILFLRRAYFHKLQQRDLVPFAFAFALVAYTIFLRNAVLVHLYRMLYGGVLSAIAGVEVVESAQAALANTRRPQRVQRMLAATAALALVLGTAPFSVLALLKSRQLGGVPLAKNFDPGMRPRAFVKRLLSLTDPTTRLYDHVSFVIRKDLFFDLDRDFIPVPGVKWLDSRPLSERSNAVLILIEPLRDAQDDAALRQLFRRYPVYRVYEYTLVDLRHPGPPLPPGDKSREHREHLRPPPPRGLLKRYWEGPYSYVELES